MIHNKNQKRPIKIHARKCSTFCMNYIRAPLCGIWIIISDHKNVKSCQSKMGHFFWEEGEKRRNRKRRKRREGRKRGREGGRKRGKEGGNKRKRERERLKRGEGKAAVWLACIRRSSLWVISSGYLSKGWTITVVIHNHRTQCLNIL